MTVPVRLAAFAGALALLGGGGAALGSLADPDRGEPAPSADHGGGRDGASAAFTLQVR